MEKIDEVMKYIDKSKMIQNADGELICSVKLSDLKKVQCDQYKLSQQLKQSLQQDKPATSNDWDQLELEDILSAFYQEALPSDDVPVSEYARKIIDLVTPAAVEITEQQAWEKIAEVTDTDEPSFDPAAFYYDMRILLKESKFSKPIKGGKSLFDNGYRIAHESELVQEPLVVPKFVAEWYEVHKYDLEQAIFDLTIDLYKKNANERSEFDELFELVEDAEYKYNEIKALYDQMCQANVQLLQKDQDQPKFAVGEYYADNFFVYKILEMAKTEEVGVCDAKLNALELSTGKIHTNLNWFISDKPRDKPATVEQIATFQRAEQFASKGRKLNEFRVGDVVRDEYGGTYKVTAINNGALYYCPNDIAGRSGDCELIQTAEEIKGE